MYRFNNFPHIDGRSDLGYGTYDKNHKNSKASSTFPYYVDDVEDEEPAYDEDFLVALLNKLGDVKSFDALNFKSADAGSQGDFMRKMNMIGEASTHISPIPNLYKNKQAVSGGTYPSKTKGFTGYSNKTLPTGGKKGWTKGINHRDVPKEDKNLEKLRYLIKLIHSNQEAL